MRYIFSNTLLILLFAASAFGQGKFVPNGIRVGANLNPLIKTLTNEQINQFEITGDINFHKYLLTVDLGQAKMDRRSNNFIYITEGFYYKGGVDVNFLHNLEGNSAMGLGFRYARSDFYNNLSWIIAHPLWGTEIETIRNGQVQSQWFEGLLHLKVDTWQNFQLGFSLGLKFARSMKGDENFDVYEIPGYGYAEATSLWSFNYYLYYYIPFRKKLAPSNN